MYKTLFTNPITIYHNYGAGENIAEFGKLTVIRQCFTYQYFPYA